MGLWSAVQPKLPGSDKVRRAHERQTLTVVVYTQRGWVLARSLAARATADLTDSGGVRLCRPSLCKLPCVGALSLSGCCQHSCQTCHTTCHCAVLCVVLCCGDCRSACLFWLMFAGIHEMPATASSLLSICCSLHSSLAAVHAADNASPAGNEPEDASAAAVAEEPAATQESPDAPAAAAGGAAAATPSGLEPAAALVQRTPAQQWVFEDDVGCGTSSSKRSDAEGTQEVSTQTPPGVHIKEGCTVMRSGVSRLLSAFSVLAVLLAMMLVARLTGWLPHALNLLHAMWVPLVVLTAGCILGLIVLWQQPGSAGEGGEYDLLADETEPFSKHGSAGAMYAVPVGEGEGQAGLVEK